MARGRKERRTWAALCGEREEDSVASGSTRMNCWKLTVLSFSMRRLVVADSHGSKGVVSLSFWLCLSNGESESSILPLKNFFACSKLQFGVCLEFLGLKISGKGRIWLPGALIRFAPLENDASVIIRVVPRDRSQPLVAAGPLFLSKGTVNVVNSPNLHSMKEPRESKNK
ncbi:hypothetical protein TIFTF001_039452 [Ficus carica]|uniref:Uncharacterized protein n=1 Tax=Ficus carica TaxID=3494 RepID=A0AA88E967_FICCA|nr:hypothetical protein TIFTF001_039452 [Ficus carica]